MAIFVFLVILILFFGILGSMAEPERGERLSRDAELITKALTGRSDTSIIEDNKLDTEKVKEFVSDDPTLPTPKYEDLKQELGIKGEFCIYLEDSEGNLIPILVEVDPGHDGVPDTDDDVLKYVHGVGNNGAIINEKQCGEEFTG